MIFIQSNDSYKPQSVIQYYVGVYEIDYSKWLKSKRIKQTVLNRNRFSLNTYYERSKKIVKAYQCPQMCLILHPRAQWNRREVYRYL